jgi:hypothetical protein
MQHPSNDKIDPSFGYVFISVRKDPAISKRGPTNSHENHSSALAMYARFVFPTPPTPTKNHETTAAQSRPTTKTKIDIDDRVTGHFLLVVKEPA